MTRNKMYVLIAVLVLGFIVFISLPQESFAPTKNSIPVVIQPDSVPPVLVPAISGDATLGLGEKGQIGDLSIVWTEPLQDSRCPKSVQCVWAGQVVVNVTLADKTNSKTVSMILGKTPQLFDGHMVSITAVDPYPTATGKISANDYRVTFHVSVDTPVKE